MIVSHSRKFIYVKGLKVASTSMQMALAKVCGPEDIVTPVAETYIDYTPTNHLRPGHTSYNSPTDHTALLYSADMTAHAIRRLFPEEWEEYFTFTGVRNPWDKALSLYHHNVYAGNPAGSNPSEAILSGAMSLSQWDWYSDENGPMVDFFVHYEHLQRDLAVVGRRIGLDGPLPMPERARTEYRTDRTPYQEVLTPEAAQFIADQCAREIAEFGYEYEQPDVPTVGEALPVILSPVRKEITMPTPDEYGELIRSRKLRASAEYSLLDYITDPEGHAATVTYLFRTVAALQDMVEDLTKEKSNESGTSEG